MYYSGDKIKGEKKELGTGNVQKKRYANRVLMQKTETKRPLGRRRRRWKSIKMELKIPCVIQRNLRAQKRS
jgi:hypothetical protein